MRYLKSNVVLKIIHDHLVSSLIDSSTSFSVINDISNKRIDSDAKFYRVRFIKHKDTQWSIAKARATNKTNCDRNKIQRDINSTRHVAAYVSVCEYISLHVIRSFICAFARACMRVWSEKDGNLLSIRMMAFRDWACFVSPWTEPSMLCPRPLLCIRKPILT